MRHGTRMEIVLEAILDTGFMGTVDAGSSIFWELEDEESRRLIARALNVGLACCGWTLVVGDRRAASVPVVGPRRRVDRVPVVGDFARLSRGSVIQLDFDDDAEPVVVKDTIVEYSEAGLRRVSEVQVLRLPADGVMRPLDLDTLA